MFVYVKCIVYIIFNFVIISVSIYIYCIINWIWNIICKFKVSKCVIMSNMWDINNCSVVIGYYCIIRYFDMI